MGERGDDQDEESPERSDRTLDNDFLPVDHDADIYGEHHNGASLPTLDFC